MFAFLTFGDGHAALQDRPHSYKFPREVKVLDKEYVGNYKHNVIKHDVFIAGNVVEINDPIFSNGGDVIIIANTLYLNAPIDTRVYFEVERKYWHGTKDINKHASLENIADKGVLSSYDALYTWSEQYITENKRYEYRVADFGQAQSSYRAPQLPSGLVPLAERRTYGSKYDTVRATNGDDAPDKFVIQESVKSGSIRIFVHKFHLCAKCIAALDFRSSPKDGDEYDLERAIFLYAAGLKGGRGAAGSLYACPVVYSVGCGSLHTRNGGISGRPGRAGDAGDIAVYYVNRRAQASERKLIIRGSNADGGRPAHTHLQRTRSYDHLNQNGARSGFLDEVPVGSLQKLYGRKGSITVETINTDGALRLISNYLHEAELAGNYALDILLQEIEGNPTLFSLSPSESLTSFLQGELARLQLQLLEHVPQTLKGSGAIVPLPPLLRTLSCEEYPFLLPLQRDYLREICNFKATYGMDLVRSYFYNIGGIFKARPIEDVNVGRRYQDLIVEITRLNGNISILISELIKTRIQIYDYITDSQRNEIIVKLSIMREELSQVKKKLRSDGSEGFSGIIEDVQHLGTSFANAYAGIKGGEWAIAAKNIYGSARKLGEMWTGRPATAGDGTSALQVSITSIEKKLAEFNFAVQKTRNGMLAARSQAFRELLETRRRIVERERLDAFAFANQLRASFQEYLLTAFQPVVGLEANLAVLKGSIDGSTTSMAALDVSPVKDLCEEPNSAVPLEKANGKLGCVEVKLGQDKPFALVLMNRLPDFPLVVFSSGNTSHLLSLSYSVKADEVMLLKLRHP